jgi:hypothetical protein
MEILIACGCLYDRKHDCIIKTYDVIAQLELPDPSPSPAPKKKKVKGRRCRTCVCVGVPGDDITYVVVVFQSETFECVASFDHFYYWNLQTPPTSDDKILQALQFTNLARTVSFCYCS